MVAMSMPGAEVWFSYWQKEEQRRRETNTDLDGKSAPTIYLLPPRLKLCKVREKIEWKAK